MTRHADMAHPIPPLPSNVRTGPLPHRDPPFYTDPYTYRPSPSQWRRVTAEAIVLFAVAFVVVALALIDVR